MFEKSYEERLELWSKFRSSLEESETPFEDVINYFSQAKLVTLNADPWDRSTWPDPWEMIFENEYCEFISVLGWYYSLQLTERFSRSNFEIHISTAEEKSYQYLLFVDDFVLGLSDESKVILKNKLPTSYQPQQVYTLPVPN